MNSSSPKILAIGYSFGLVILGYFACRLFTTKPPWIFLDNANLAIHEGGHLIFSPFDEFLHVLGGSLFQVLVPVLFAGYFLYQRKVFSTLFCVFWVGNNLINVATYMKDATIMVLPLLGGGEHDWNWIFSTLHILSYDQVIGNAVFGLGVLCIGASLFSFVLLIGMTLTTKQLQ